MKYSNRYILLLMAVFILGQSIAVAQDATDKEVLKLIKDSGTTKDYPKADALIIFDRTNATMEGTGLAHVHKHVLIKILTEKGASKFATIRFDYDPASSSTEVKHLKVYRKDGKVKPLGKTAVKDLPQPQHSIYWGARMYIASFPKLEVGDAIEYKTYMKGFVIAYLRGNGDDEKYIPPMRGHFYDVTYFADFNPIKEKSYELKTPKNKPILFEVFNGEVATRYTYDDKFNYYRWAKSNIPKLKTEPNMSQYGGLLMSYSDSITKVVLATVPNWPKKSIWFYHVNEDRNVFGYNDDIKKKVDEITRGLKTDQEKISALLHWSADNIRYSGISMGKGEGYTIHSGAMTFNDRAGVCKDKAGMLITMLKVAGYEAYAAMTQAGSNVEQIAADQFNHCVVALKKKDDSYWMLDPTWAVLSRKLWSTAEGEQHYVIGTKEGEELMITPPFPAEQNAIHIRAKTSLHKKGTLSSTIEIDSDGYGDTRLRRFVGYRLASDRVHAFEKTLSSISPFVNLKSLTHGKPMDYKKSFKVKMRYEAPHYAQINQELIRFIPPLSKHILADVPGFANFLKAASLKERKHQIMLRCGWSLTFEETIGLPSGYTLKAAPKKISIEGSAAKMTYSIVQKGNTLKIFEHYQIKHRRILPNEYANYKKVIDAVQKLRTEPIYLERK